MTGGRSIIFKIENQTNCVDQSLILMLVSSILILCVRICSQACIRDGTTMKKHKNSRHHKIEFEGLKKISSQIFKQPELNAKLRVTTLGLLFPFLPCQEARPSLTDDDIKGGTNKRELDELRNDYIREKRSSIEDM